MGKQLLSQLLPALEQLEWTGAPAATAAGYTVYEVAVDQVDGFHGDPKALAAAIRTLRTSESNPYAFAGVAYVLLAASREIDGSYDPTGLDVALTWLERAQETAPDVVDINVIEPLLYIAGGRLEDAQIVLNYLIDQAPGNFYVRRAAMLFWQRQGDLQEAMAWNRKASEAAQTTPQRVRLKISAAELLEEAGNTGEAADAYREAFHFAPENPWLAHKASALYFELGNVEEATQFNERALKLDPSLVEAQQLRQQMLPNEGSTGFLRRLMD
jgi:tetratricopeptide (TPR) repeat protein